MHAILKMLQGGDRRSIGRSNEVAALVLEQPELFGVLICGVALDDPLVRMRCADAAEKVTALHPEYLRPYKRTLIAGYSRIEQKEVRWHIAVLLARLPLTEKEQKRVIEILLAYTNDSSSIVKTMAMQALADLAKDDEKLQPLVRRHIEELSIIGTPAMRARGKHLLTELNRSRRSLDTLSMNTVKKRQPTKLEGIPNIGKAIASDLRAIGILHPQQLAKHDPLATYFALGERMGHRHDPCVLYTLMAAKHYLESGESISWWKFTEDGRKLLSTHFKHIGN